jgi:hypothetical protein
MEIQSENTNNNLASSNKNLNTCKGKAGRPKKTYTQEELMIN